MKRLTALTLAMIIALSLVGGGSQIIITPAAASVTTEQPGDDFLVGVLIYAFANEYMSYVRRGIQEGAAELGITVEIVDAGMDQARQIDQADTLISKGVDAMIIAPVESAACQTFIDKCVDAGVPVVLLNPKPEQDVIDSYDLCWYVGAATQQPGEAQAEMILEDWNADPGMDKNGDDVLQYVLLHGMRGHANAEARIRGVYRIFDEAGLQYEELDVQEAGWDTTRAKDITDAWLMRYGDRIEVIISNNDAMALGAIESLKAEGFTGDRAIPVYGINAIEAGLEALREGTLMGTVMSDTISEGKVSVRILHNVLTGKDTFDGIDYEITDKAVAIYGLPIRLDNIELAEAMYR